MAERTIFDELTAQIERAFRDLDPTLPPIATSGQSATELAALRAAASGVETATDNAAWFRAVGTWRTAYRNLAATAVGPAQDKPDALAARVLMTLFPRLAAFLALSGVITT